MYLHLALSRSIAEFYVKKVSMLALLIIIWYNTDIHWYSENSIKWGWVMPVIQKRAKSFKPARTIAFSFLIVIFLGTALLMLPVSSRSGDFTPFRHAFFTATSATCVTGLVIYDTFQHWSYFGQFIILLMIQIGGLGLVTFVSFFNFIIGRKLGLRRMQVASESVSGGGFDEAKSLIRNIIKLSLVFEGVGAVLLMFAFIPRHGSEGIFMSIFIAVSAFCNAGFDVMGRTAEFSSLTGFYNNPYVLSVVMVLIICGGLGFVVWHDLSKYRKTGHLELHTRIVLTITGILIVFGAIFFAFFEWNNPLTLSNMSIPEKVFNSIFQSITCRTAGFNTIDIASLNPITKIFSIMIMFIGAAPGSTGGGIKVTTIVVIVMTVISILTNKEETTVFGRRVDKFIVYKSITITMLSMMAIFIGSMSVFFSLPAELGVSGVDTVFEVTSAFATVGLSSGVTANLNIFSEMIIIFIMFIGRVGPISVVLSLTMNSDDRSKNQVVPEGRVMVG